MIDREVMAKLVVRNPKIMSGTPVFAGTRVPVQALFDYLQAGDSLDIFIDHFPTVDRAQAVALLELLKEVAISQAAVVTAG